MVGGQADGSPSNSTAMTALVLADGREPRRSLTTRETIFRLKHNVGLSQPIGAF